MNMRWSGTLMTGFVAITLAALAQQSVGAAVTRYDANWASLDRRPMPAWYQDAKFGVFIHWGIYSVPAWAPVGEYAEWYWNRIESPDPKFAVWREYHTKHYGPDFRYADFAPQFTAGLFDAGQWADLVARSGAKYVVLTSKHCDGFALWPSTEASRTWGRPWNAMEIGPKRDLLGELAAATRRRGLRFGLYYSLYEWFNPLWKVDRARYVAEHMMPQFKDVVTRYHPAIIFSDGDWDLPSKDWRSEELLAWLFNESPSMEDVVVNDRWGKETRHKHGGYWTTEYAAGLPNGSHPWEESRGMAYSYGLNRAETVDDYKTSRDLIFTLIDLVSRGGNLLLDIGPAADGTIPPLMAQRLLDIGAWLKVNGEAIYGTRPAGRDCQWTEGTRPKQDFGDFKVRYEVLEELGQAPENGAARKQVFFTSKPGLLYAITAGWPGRQLVLDRVRVPVGAKIAMLGVPGELATTVSGTTLTITMPEFRPDQTPCRDAFVLRIEGGEALPDL